MENCLNMIIRHRAVSTQWYCQNSIDIPRWLGLNFLSQVLRFRPPVWSFARIYSTLLQKCFGFFGGYLKSTLNMGRRNFWPWIEKYNIIKIRPISSNLLRPPSVALNLLENTLGLYGERVSYMCGACPRNPNTFVAVLYVFWFVSSTFVEAHEPSETKAL